MKKRIKIVLHVFGSSFPGVGSLRGIPTIVSVCPRCRRAAIINSLSKSAYHYRPTCSTGQQCESVFERCAQISLKRWGVGQNTRRSVLFTIYGKFTNPQVTTSKRRRMGVLERANVSSTLPSFWKATISAPAILTVCNSSFDNALAINVCSGMSSEGDYTLPEWTFATRRSGAYLWEHSTADCLQLETLVLIGKPFLLCAAPSSSGGKKRGGGVYGEGDDEKARGVAEEPACFADSRRARRLPWRPHVDAVVAATLLFNQRRGGPFSLFPSGILAGSLRRGMSQETPPKSSGRVVARKMASIVARANSGPNKKRFQRVALSEVAKVVAVEGERGEDSREVAKEEMCNLISRTKCDVTESWYEAPVCCHRTERALTYKPIDRAPRSVSFVHRDQPHSPQLTNSSTIAAAARQTPLFSHPLPLNHRQLFAVTSARTAHKRVIEPARTTNCWRQLLDFPDEAEMRREWSSAGMQGAGVGRCPKKTPRPAASSHAIPTFAKIPGATRQGDEPGSPWWQGERSNRSATACSVLSFASIPPFLKPSRKPHAIYFVFWNAKCSGEGNFVPFLCRQPVRQGRRAHTRELCFDGGCFEYEERWLGHEGLFRREAIFFPIRTPGYRTGNIVGLCTPKTPPPPRALAVSGAARVGKTLAVSGAARVGNSARRQRHELQQAAVAGSESWQHRSPSAGQHDLATPTWSARGLASSTAPTCDIRESELATRFPDLLAGCVFCSGWRQLCQGGNHVLTSSATRIASLGAIKSSSRLSEVSMEQRRNARAGKRETPEKTRRPAASSGTIPTCENPGGAPPGIDTAISTLAPTKPSRVQSPVGSPDFRKWESCRTMPLVGGFSRGYPVSPAPSFQRRSIFTSITLIGSQDLARQWIGQFGGWVRRTTAHPEHLSSVRPPTSGVTAGLWRKGGRTSLNTGFHVPLCHFPPFAGQWLSSLPPDKWRGELQDRNSNSYKTGRKKYSVQDKSSCFAIKGTLEETSLPNAKGETAHRHQISRSNGGKYVLVVLTENGGTNARSEGEETSTASAEKLWLYSSPSKDPLLTSCPVKFHRGSEVHCRFSNSQRRNIRTSDCPLQPIARGYMIREGIKSRSHKNGGEQLVQPPVGQSVSTRAHPAEGPRVPPGPRRRGGGSLGGLWAGRARGGSRTAPPLIGGPREPFTAVTHAGRDRPPSPHFTADFLPSPRQQRGAALCSSIPLHAVASLHDRLRRSGACSSRQPCPRNLPVVPSHFDEGCLDWVSVLPVILPSIGAAPLFKGRGNGDPKRKPADPRHRPARSPTSEIPEAIPTGFETGSPWWEASSLTAERIPVGELSMLLKRNRICSLNYGRPENSRPPTKKNGKLGNVEDGREIRITSWRAPLSLCVMTELAVCSSGNLSTHLSRGVAVYERPGTRDYKSYTVRTSRHLEFSLRVLGLRNDRFLTVAHARSKFVAETEATALRGNLYILCQIMCQISSPARRSEGLNTNTLETDSGQLEHLRKRKPGCGVTSSQRRDRCTLIQQGMGFEPATTRTCYDYNASRLEVRGISAVLAGRWCVSQASSDTPSRAGRRLASTSSVSHGCCAAGCVNTQAPLGTSVCVRARVPPSPCHFPFTTLDLVTEVSMERSSTGVQWRWGKRIFPRKTRLICHVRKVRERRRRESSRVRLGERRVALAAPPPRSLRYERVDLWGNVSAVLTTGSSVKLPYVRVEPLYGKTSMGYLRPSGAISARLTKLVRRQPDIRRGPCSPSLQEWQYKARTALPPPPGPIHSSQLPET
ncbi:hypothetical protein PR048_004379, partial [Dryococelus australis]